MNEEINYLISNDSNMKQIFDLYGKPFIPSRPQGFETLLKLILEQQVSLESAKATFLRLKTLLVLINPETICKTTTQDLKDIGISKQKIVYINELAKAVLDDRIDLDSFPNKSDVEVRNELIQIKGIGNWTIDIYLMFSLQKKDVMPLGDIAIVNTIKELYNCLTKEEISIVSEKWKPFRTMASFFLWHYYLEKRNRKPLQY